jgi:hypothetical protein
MQYDLWQVAQMELDVRPIAWARRPRSDQRQNSAGYGR